jgi:cytochrome c peroxidase
MKPRHTSPWAVLTGAVLPAALALAGPLGLPPVPVPDEKIVLGSALFNDKRFSSTGEVRGATCHDPAKAFTDSPRKTSEGIRKPTGTRNAPTVVNRIQDRVPDLAPKFLEAKARGMDVDVKVLTDPDSSELGRFAVTNGLDELGAFKTPTLRNVAVTAPFMHDGSLATLRDVVVHYNNGGVTNKGEPVNDYLSGGIRPPNLTEEQISDLVAFMEALTSPQFAKSATTASIGGPSACNLKSPAPAATATALASAGVQP